MSLKIDSVDIFPFFHSEVKCKLRYDRNCRKYERQFQKELYMLEKYQPSAYSAARFHRHMSITTLWPPLHNIKEIDYAPIVRK
uniref:Uncharacterized protein n=1 Tax=Megaselia scalaris TaxID=36166 RepID=T1GXE3_MEGSC